MGERVVWKYALPNGYLCDEVLDGPVLLCQRDSAGSMCVWIEGDPAAAKVRRTFHVLGTGQAFPAHLGLIHLGSWVSGAHVWLGSWVSSAHVWHCYEEPSTEGVS